MKKVILFGATGNLGKKIAEELVNQGYDLTVVARNEAKARTLADLAATCVIASINDHEQLNNILANQEIVISALGKSVSLNDNSRATFKEVDFDGNMNILKAAIQARIKKFVYVSAFHSEKHLHLSYFRVHHDFSEELKKSGIDYSIIKPPAIFCAFLDVIEMARKGQLVNIGKGDKRTNPIFEGDLAKVATDAILRYNSTIEAGGKTIYTRRQLNEIIQYHVDGKKKLKTIPLSMIKFILPLIRPFNKNIFDKFAFFIEVMQHDTIAPQVGIMTFEDYVKQKININQDGSHQVYHGNSD